MTTATDLIPNYVLNKILILLVVFVQDLAMKTETEMSKKDVMQTI